MYKIIRNCVWADVKEIFAVQVDGLEPGEYDMYLQFQGKIRKLRNELRVK